MNVWNDEINASKSSKGACDALHVPMGTEPNLRYAVQRFRPYDLSIPKMFTSNSI